jgi:tetratricopeptide (TPR) repeat protein
LTAGSPRGALRTNHLDGGLTRPYDQAVRVPIIGPWRAACAPFFLWSGMAAAAPGFWEKVADPDSAVVEGLVARARAQLDRGVAGGPSRENAVRAEALLSEALRRKPRHFAASFLRGDALVLQGRAGEAIAAIARACNLADSSDDESTCTLRLAVEEARAGRHADALASYDRHLRSGGAQPIAYTNSAEILMALGRLGEAAGRYREAIRLEEGAPPGRQRDEGLALARYGLGVALDRDDQEAAAREAIARATALDPRLRLLDPEAAGDDVFFVPPGDLHYYRGLALRVLARREEAAEAFRRFVKEVPRSPYVARAQAHLRALVGEPSEGAAAPAQRLRVVGAATLGAEGPLPAPLVDATLKGQAGLLASCFEEAPPLPGSPLRLRLELTIDARGGLKRVEAEAPPPGWDGVPACLEQKLKQAVRFPRPSRSAPTRARFEMLLAPHDIQDPQRVPNPPRSFAPNPGSPRPSAGVGWSPGSPRPSAGVGWSPGSLRPSAGVGWNRLGGYAREEKIP